MATQDEYIKTALRLPRSLHADIQASAERLGRSMNAEIIDRIERSFSSPDPAETLQTILRIERDKIDAEMELDLARLQLAYLARIYAIADDRLTPIAKQAPSSDLLTILDKGKALLNEIERDPEPEPTARLTKNLERAKQLELEIRQINDPKLLAEALKNYPPKK